MSRKQDYWFKEYSMECIKKDEQYPRKKTSTLNEFRWFDNKKVNTCIKNFLLFLI